MSLAYAILGWLEKEPMSGYTLKKRFDQGIGYFWPADQMQIYRTLDRLVAEGHVSVAEEIQHGRPNRKIYTLMAAGREALQRWLTEPQALPTVRDPLLIQLFFATPLANSEIVGVLEQQREAHRQRLAAFQQLIPFPLEAPAGTPGASRRQRLRRLVLEQGIRREQAYLDWLEMALDVVGRLPE